MQPGHKADDRTGAALHAAAQHLGASRLQEADAILREVLRLAPANAHALHLLGLVLQQSGQHADAAELFRRAIAAGADGPPLRNHLGFALKSLGRLKDAIRQYRRALALDPGNPESHNNLASALHAAGDTDAAVAGFGRAIALRPQLFEAHFNLGNALKDRSELEGALASYDRALALRPGHPDAEVNRGMTLLLKGDYAGGWDGYEYRFDNRSAPAAQPLWRGEPASGKTILLTAEQGYGDTLQFVRYVPRVAAGGARVILEVQRDLHSLLQNTEGAATVLARGDSRPPFDLQCPLPSLPLAFATRLDSIPAAVPYVAADPARVERWRERLGPPAGMRVGLAWAGSPTHVNDRNRSLPLRLLSGLAGLPGIRFFSLQKGAAVGEAVEAAFPGLTLPGEALADFADTAAAVAHLDLVVSVDTSVAHLAGAMGKPVWVLLPHAPDWRWLLGREDSPWYPHARLIRQPRAGDWASVVARVRATLLQRQAT